MSRSSNDLKKLAEDTIKKFGGKQEDYRVSDWGGETCILKINNDALKTKPVLFISDLTINEISMLNGIFSDWKLNLEEGKGTMEWIVKMLNGDKEDQDKALIEVIKNLRESKGLVRLEKNIDLSETLYKKLKFEYDQVLEYKNGRLEEKTWK